MTAKEFLSQAYWIEQLVRSKMFQIEQLRALASHVSAFAKDTTVIHSRNVTGLQNTVARILEAEEELNAEVERLVETRKQIQEVIDRVSDPVLHLILEKRYLLFERWGKIINDLAYAKRWVMHRHQEALRIVEEEMRFMNLD